jgi:predicted RecB family nuclease
VSIRVLENTWELSSRDIWRGANCQHCTDLGMAVATKDPNTLKKVDGHKPDLSKVLAIIQGNDYEAMLLDQLRMNLRGDIVALEEFASVEKTMEAINARPMAIAQAGLKKKYGSVILGGYADLLIRDDFEPGIDANGFLTLLPSGQDFTGYTVWDIKHNAKVKDEYLFQVGGYVDALESLGHLSKQGKSGIITRAKQAKGFSSAELVASFTTASEGMFRYLSSNLPTEFKPDTNFIFECPTSTICDKIFCEYPGLCEQERYERDDIGQLYGLHYTHRPKLEAAGFGTVASIATAEASKAKGVIPDEQFAKYQPWAKVINDSRVSGQPKVASLVDPSEFKSLLPERNEGDLFVDFEWFHPTGESAEFIYMLSASDWNEEFYPFVAPTRSDELKAFKAFVAFVIQRIRKYPDAHIYHFHNPETDKLKKLTETYGVLKDEVEHILGHMFDIKKKVVHDRMVTSFAELGIKQLGKFYLSDHGAKNASDSDETVEDGLESMLFFYNYQKALKSGSSTNADSIMEKILEYNKADCTATSRLYTWLFEGQFDRA